MFQANYVLSWFVMLLLLLVFGLSDANLVSNCSDHCTCNEESSTGNSFIVSCTELTKIPDDVPLEVNELYMTNSNLVEFSLADLVHLKSLKKLVLHHCCVKNFISHPDLTQQLPNLEVLDISHNNLTIIPPDLPSSLRILLLNNNSITEVNYKSSLAHLVNLEELFLGHNLLVNVTVTTFHDLESQTSLKSLRKLTLNANELNSLDAGSFHGFHSLLALTFANNDLIYLKGEMLSGLKSLKHFDASINQLMRIDDDTFQGLSQLKYVNLSHNQLVSFPKGLPMLEWLDLSHNMIHMITEDLKSSVYPIEVLNLASNPFHCDCHLRWLKELYDRREYLVKHLEIDAKDFIPVCASPESLKGETWDLLGDEVFKCHPAGAQINAGFDAGAVELSSRIGVVTDTTIQLIWTSSAPHFTNINVVIHYYVFGHRSTTMKYIEVSAAQPEFIIKQLHPATNYVICVQPKNVRGDHSGSSHSPTMSLSDCFEVVTKDPKPPVLTSRLEMFFYYVLGMLATFIGIFSAIGGFAMMYGMWTSSTHWSARYVADDTYLDGSTYPTDEPLTKDSKPHKD